MTMPAKPEVTIQGIAKVPAREPSRLGKGDLLITYLVNGRHTMTLTIPDDGATESTIETAVRADAVRFTKVIGKTLTF